MTILDDYKQFLNSQPEEERVFETIEIQHPSLSQVFRFVRDSKQLTAKDENEIDQTYEPIAFISDNSRISDDLVRITLQSPIAYIFLRVLMRLQKVRLFMILNQSHRVKEFSLFNLVYQGSILEKLVKHIILLISQC